MYTKSIIVLFNLNCYGSLAPQIKNFTWYFPARYILLFIRRSGWGVVNVPNLLHGFEHILLSLLSLLCRLNPDLLLQSCMQAGSLFMAYIVPLTSLAHGLRVPLSNLAD